MKKVFIDGSSGTTGLRIRQRLAGRGDIELLSIPDALRKDNTAKAEVMNSADAVILCLPDAAAAATAELVVNPGTVVIDCSTSHRTTDGWAYGFPELSPEFFDKIKISKKITNPGCHATGCCAILYPIVICGTVSEEYPAVFHSLTGYSGGGKGMIAEYEDKDRAEKYASPAEYALSAAHKHLPEIKKVCGLKYAPALNPIVADYYSGMVVCLPILRRLMNKAITAERLRALYAEYYSLCPLINVLPYEEVGVSGGRIYSNTLSGRDSMEIIVCGGEETLNVYARFDNLGKGASGAAVQNLNIALGLEQYEGLEP